MGNCIKKKNDNTRNTELTDIEIIRSIYLKGKHISNVTYYELYNYFKFLTRRYNNLMFTLNHTIQNVTFKVYGNNGELNIFQNGYLIKPSYKRYIDFDIDIDIDIDENETEYEMCCICLEELHSSKCVITVCNHVFHKECLDQSVNLQFPNCPLCRELIIY